MQCANADVPLSFFVRVESQMAPRMDVTHAAVEPMSVSHFSDTHCPAAYRKSPLDGLVVYHQSSGRGCDNGRKLDNRPVGFHGDSRLFCTHLCYNCNAHTD